MPGPPPPPPMPPMGRGAGGPPPPPPMPGMKAPASKPPSGAGRGALLSDINKGARLKKVTQVNDRSAPQVGKVSDAPSGPPIGGAPPVPGMGKAPAPPLGLAPPVPGRVRSNSDTGGDGARDSTAMSGGAPQLAGLFAGGMPKLRKAGGVKTGAESNSPYLSDPETSRSSAPKPPRAAAPKPPGAAPSIPGIRPPPNPAISALRNNLRPPVASTYSLPDLSSKPKPPPPIGKKPPIPPPTSRKPSGFASPPLASPARPPPAPGSFPSAPRAPPPTHTPSAPPPPPPSSIPSAPPPPPPSSAPRPPPVRSTAPPPPPSALAPKAQPEDDDYDPYRYTNSPLRPPSAPAPPAPKAPPNGHSPSLAEQAARNAFGRASPASPPPPPPAASPPSAPSAPAPPPPPTSAPSRPATQAPVRSMLDASSYTLTNGGSGLRSGPTSPGVGGDHRSKIQPIHDLRWRFQSEAQFPRPREFSGGTKRYRAGRGSSVPLNLSAYE